MLWNRYFLPFFLVLCLVAFLHWIGTDLLYYWTFWWYDIVTHFLGGLWTTLAILWVLEMPPFRSLGRNFSVASVVLATLIVGVSWEIYEIYFGFADVNMVGYVTDTLCDLGMDTLGAMVVMLVYARDIISSSKQS